MNDATVDKLLLVAFFRRDCPETMTLGDYQMGLLSGETEQEVQTHLARCPNCREEIERLAAFLTSAANNPPP